ncbi:hypothetical protein BH23PLA1_BH23PLA1_15350 [soil metagenome]
MKDYAAELAVTLSAELYESLAAEARELGVPLEWVIASLVVDTMEARTEPLKPIAA